MTKINYFLTRFLGLRGSWKWAKTRMFEGYTVCVPILGKKMALLKMEKGKIYGARFDPTNKSWTVANYEPIEIDYFWRRQTNYKIFN